METDSGARKSTTGWATLSDFAETRPAEEKQSDKARILQLANSSTHGLEHKLAQVADSRMTSLSAMMAAARKKNTQAAQQQQQQQKPAAAPPAAPPVVAEDKESSSRRTSITQERKSSIVVSPTDDSGGLPFRRRTSTQQATIFDSKEEEDEDETTIVAASDQDPETEEKRRSSRMELRDPAVIEETRAALAPEQPERRPSLNQMSERRASLVTTTERRPSTTPLASEPEQSQESQQRRLSSSRIIQEQETEEDSTPSILAQPERRASAVAVSAGIMSASKGEGTATKGEDEEVIPVAAAVHDNEKRGSIILVPHERPMMSDADQPVEKRGSLVILGSGTFVVEATFSDDTEDADTVVADAYTVKEPSESHKAANVVKRASSLSSATMVSGTGSRRPSAVAAQVEATRKERSETEALPVVVVASSRRGSQVNENVRPMSKRLSVVAVPASLVDESETIATAEVEEEAPSAKWTVLPPASPMASVPSEQDQELPRPTPRRSSRAGPDELPPLSPSRSGASSSTAEDQPTPPARRSSSIFGMLRRKSLSISPPQEGTVVVSAGGSRRNSSSAASSVTLDSQQQPLESPLMVYRKPSLDQFASGAGGNRRSSLARMKKESEDQQAAEADAMAAASVASVAETTPEPARQEQEEEKQPEEQPQQQKRSSILGSLRRSSKAEPERELTEEEMAQAAAKQARKDSQDVLKKIQNLTARTAELTGLGAELEKVEKDRVAARDATRKELEDTLKEQEDVEAQIEILKLRRKALQLKSGELDETFEKQELEAKRAAEERELTRLAVEQTAKDKDALLDKYAELQQRHPDRIKPISTREMITSDSQPSRNRRLTFPIPGQTPTPAPPLVLRGLFQLKKDTNIDKIAGPIRVSNSTKQVLLKVPDLNQKSPPKEDQAQGAAPRRPTVVRNGDLPKPPAKLLGELKSGQVSLRKVEAPASESPASSQGQKPSSVMGRLARTMNVRREVLEVSDGEEDGAWD